MTVAEVETRPPARVMGPSGLAGLHLEVRDLTATQRFYEHVFAPSGNWLQEKRRLTYSAGSQRVTFHQSAHPRTGRGTGQHQAYGVPADRLGAVAEALASSGSTVSWWREDRPEEHTVTAYVEDPSGNLVQLVASAGSDIWIDHVAVEVHDLDLAEPFYVSVLGGAPDYWHGWKEDDYAEAFAWGEGKDPCAPWTRRYDVRYWDKLRIPRPNMQLFVRFGTGIVGLILAGEHHQEPPPEKQRGTPRVVLRTSASAEEMQARLRVPRVAPDLEGGHVFVRDCSGNYLELVTAG